jgi:diguanylate cyclase (GGDEF)-like protein
VWVFADLTQKGRLDTLGDRTILAGKSRKRQLLLPIAAMTLGALLLLVGLAMFLVDRFDDTAVTREQRVVESGFAQQLRQFDALIVPQVNWDKAVAKVDRTLDLAFADLDFGKQLYTFDGFTHTFFVDGDERVTYAYVYGQHQDPLQFEPFRAVTRQLLRPIREAELRRGPIRPHAEGQGPITRPIQANGIARIDGKAYVIMASLVQPDLGYVQPKGPRATVVINAMPINRAMLDAFAARYLLDRLDLVPAPEANPDRAYLPLKAPDGSVVAALSWVPRKPGTALLHAMMVPLTAAMALLALVSWTIVRRSGVIVDELIASEMRAKHLAYHDTLTRLPNRALLFDRLRGLLATLSPRWPLLGMLCIDLDRFKEVNDTLGHQAGDELLKVMADRLRALARDEHHAFTARLGGDEFVLVALAADRGAIEILAQRCLAALLTPVDSEFGRLDVGCSIGIAVIDGSVGEPSLALRQADLALYRAKARGRGCVTFYEPEMEAAFQSRRVLETSLRAALESSAFHMVYQPQVDAVGTVRAYEALLRWDHPEHGAISPASFIPLAEECGLILGIGEFVLRRVFAETYAWPDVRVAINVSAIQMRAPGFAAKLVQIAAWAGIDPARYDIELTETALLTDTPATNENFSVLKRMGFAIVLDDFGTGNSSLSLLHRFRVDKIKIDRSFVADLGQSVEAETLVGAIVKLARSFHLGVIAEGVETEAQKRLLIAAGCEEFQGYLTGRPVPACSIAEAMTPRQIVQRRV